MSQGYFESWRIWCCKLLLPIHWNHFCSWYEIKVSTRTETRYPSCELESTPKKYFAPTAFQTHWLNIELDLQSLFVLHVHSCTHWLRNRNTPPPCIWALIRRRYLSAKIDDISLWPSGETWQHRHFNIQTAVLLKHDSEGTNSSKTGNYDKLNPTS